MAEKKYGSMIYPTSLNPAYAFPLDFRTLMTKEEAESAALSAKEAGNRDTNYYYGMSIQVIESGVVNTYVITPDNKLEKTASNEIPKDINSIKDTINNSTNGILTRLAAIEKNSGSSGNITTNDTADKHSGLKIIDDNGDKKIEIDDSIIFIFDSGNCSTIIDNLTESEG